MPAPSVVLSTVFSGSYSANGTFTPDATAANRAVLVAIAHVDRFQDDRSTVAVQYDNTADGIVDVGHANANNGSFEWAAANADMFHLDDSFLDGQANSANLSIQATGETTYGLAIDIDHVVDGNVDASDTNSGTGTSSSITLATTLAGNVTMSHTLGSSQNFAHMAVAYEGSDGNEVIVIDIIVAWGAPTVTPGGGQSTEHSNTVSTGNLPYTMYVTSKVVSGGGGPTDYVVQAGQGTIGAVAGPATVDGGGAPASTVGSVAIYEPATSGAIPGTAYGGFDMATEVRRDDSATVSKVDASTLRLTNAAGRKFLMQAVIKLEDTSNGRATSQGRFEVTSGATSVFYTSEETGYSRDNSENEHHVNVWGVIEPNAATVDVQLQWRRDSDVPTGGSVAGNCRWTIVEIDWDAVGHYAAATTGQAYGGVALNTVVLDSTVVESDAAAISRSGNTVTVRTADARYLVLGTMYGANGGSRTQRNIRLAYTGTGAFTDVEANCYQRNAANEYAGVALTDVIERPAGNDISINMEAYRGAGVANDQGGADVDGSWTNQRAELIVLQLPTTAEVFRSHDSTGLQSVAGTADINYNVFRDVDLADAGSFTKVNDSTLEAVAAADVMAALNAWVARDNVGSGARLTTIGTWEIAGASQAYTEHSFYSRGNQGSQDTHAGSLHPAGLLAVTAGQDLTVRSARIAGGEAGNSRTQADSVSAWAINLGTLAPAATPGVTASAGGGVITAVAAASTVAVGNVAAPAGQGVIGAVGQNAQVVPGGVTASSGQGVATVVGNAATGAPGGVSASAGQGAIAAVAGGATVAVGNVGVAAGQGVVGAVGQPAAVAPGAVSAAAGGGVVGVVGGAATAFSSTAVPAGGGVVTVSGQAASVVAGGVSTSAGVGAISAVAANATVAVGAVAASAGGGVVTAVGQAATATAAASDVAAGTGVIGVVGQPATVSPGAVATVAGQGVIGVVGAPAAVGVASIAPAGAGTVTLVGQPASVAVGDVAVSASQGVITAVGNAAAALTGPKVVAGQGVITAVGNDATAVAGAPVAEVGGGVIAVVGQAATVAVGPVSTLAGAGVITASGQPATVAPGDVSAGAGQGVAVLAGQPASVFVPETAPAGTGIITAAGQPATVARVAYAPGGVITVTGLPATVIEGEVDSGAGAGVISVVGQPAGVIPGAVSTLAGQGTITAVGQDAGYRPFLVDGVQLAVLSMVQPEVELAVISPEVALAAATIGAELGMPETSTTLQMRGPSVTLRIEDWDAG